MSRLIHNKKPLGDLVENAIDFLRQSISDLTLKPKYSVIHFYAAVELFVKARLMAEHWSLVVSPKTDINWEKFSSGDFISVTLTEAEKRLKNVVGSPLPCNHSESFSGVARHRNRIVHFFHGAASGNSRMIEAIAKEKLRAWYFLHDMLLNQWSDVFGEWSESIREIDHELRKHHAFLAPAFEAVRSTIEAKRSDGYVFTECPSCGFESEEHSSEMNSLHESECLVCGLTGAALRVPCPGCDGPVIFRSEPNAECMGCHKVYDGALLREIFVDESEAHCVIKDGGDYPFPITCGECCSPETVVRIDEDQYLCTECFAITDEYGTCEYCSGASTALPEESYLHGCEFCDGRLGRDD